MEKSETIGKLAEALSKAQGAIEGAKKDSQNPFFKSTYADLASVWDAVRKPLSDNGLAIIQVPLVGINEDVLLQTVLTHSSGEWVSGIMSMKPIKHDPQGVGSVLSYLRRYCLSAFLGVAQVDDDANAASQKPEFKSKAVVAKTYEIHPDEAKDVPASLGNDEQTMDEVLLISDKKKAISDTMKGFKKEQKKEFYDFVMEGKSETVDVLQDFLDRYIEYRAAYLKSKEM